LKITGVSNFRIIIFPALISLVFGIIIVTGINTVTSKLTHKYLDIKNHYTKGNDYLAALTENGIWIKDKIEGNTNIIRAKKLSQNDLIDVSIYKFDENNKPQVRIEARKADVSSNEWQLSDAIIYYGVTNNLSTYLASHSFVSNFEINSIKNIFSNLDAVSFWELNKLKENYKYLGYSTKEVESEFQRALSFPLFLMSMTFLAGAVVMNVKYRGNYLAYVVIAMILSVIIFYLNDFSRALGETERISLIMSVWTPLSIVLIISSIGMIHVNEK
jgi:lipopolysaccharide export system permease protein